MAKRVLIVDDDPTQRRLLEVSIGRQGYDTLSADSGRDALALLNSDVAQTIDLVLLDVAMPEIDGLAVLAQIQPILPHLPVIVLTAHGGVEIVVQAMRAGAVDFIVKPASPERLQVSIENALKLNRLNGEISRLERQISGRMGFGDLIGESPAIREAAEMARRAGATDVPILIEGESGVGKEMFARAIQGASARAGRPFVTVNCGALPENLAESILFGHEKGSFTGAFEKHVGKFQEASGGTLFLDEVGELPAAIQVKLLRALQEGEIDPVGAKLPLKVDVRLISATNRKLHEQVRDGQFREDLYYRLNVFPIRIPPLREREGDIALLARFFVERIAVAQGRPVRGLTREAMALLAGYFWPGNVRQLENAIFRAVILCDGDKLGVEDFPHISQLESAPLAGRADAAPPAPAGPVDIFQAGNIRRLTEIEADVIKLALETYNGHMSEVARRLGIGRSTLYRKVADFGFDHMTEQ
jgi:DNA-binding NtrC family response regulator